MKSKSTQKKRKPRKKIFTKIMVSLIAVFLLSAATAIYFEQETSIQKMEEKNKELEILVKEARQTKDEYEELLSQSDSLEYIERIAREQLGMVKPGEVVFP